VLDIDDAPLALPPMAGDAPALESRPDVRAARDRTAAGRSAITSERTMVIRQLGATFGTKQSAGSTSFVGGVSLPFPLFDQNRGEVARARAERDEAAAQLVAIERAARAEIDGATEAARVLLDRLGTLARGPRTYLDRAEEARRIALGAYREGAVPLAQVLDAARAWGEARVTYHELLLAQHQSVLEVLVATGRDPLAGVGGAR
jgi:outer membrane protein, heavy metal efflux system